MCIVGYVHDWLSIGYDWTDIFASMNISCCFKYVTRETSHVSSSFQSAF